MIASAVAVLVSCVPQFFIQLVMLNGDTRGFEHILLLSLVVTGAHFILLIMREILNLLITGVERLNINKELRRFSSQGNVQSVKQTLRNGAQPDSTDHDGRTAFYDC
eukprot:TRINITY_DN4525_c0_g1_i1.p1 TRINITY_DN4525_c0_g1~~TRINITY_DN4525_c0_g1_i1.p1  ORF type:complete len:107 (-),score=5.49 TRINITY_DN4525_c0_g1_i1:134-454(-)